MSDIFRDGPSTATEAPEHGRTDLPAGRDPVLAPLRFRFDSQVLLLQEKREV